MNCPYVAGQRYSKSWVNPGAFLPGDELLEYTDTLSHPRSTKNYQSETNAWTMPTLEPWTEAECPKFISVILDMATCPSPRNFRRRIVEASAPRRDVGQKVREVGIKSEKMRVDGLSFVRNVNQVLVWPHISRGTKSCGGSISHQDSA